MANESNPFGDVTKIIEQFKVPGIDMAAIAEARRKDIQALVDANKAAYEGMQALSRKQADMLTQTLQGIQEVAGGAGFGDPSKQTELVRKAFEKTLADMKELAELARNSQADAMSHVTQRAAEHMQELKKLMQPK
ncbi:MULTISPECIES: phasin family protein [unclassified Variovorax]|uniref:phasin family protein n=1 Tax=unclassified Variovorax TaxID=663243 RepID=UPI0013178785|nr:MULTISPECIES: TIGR01841 family phasin [unclassified Variovorax]VTU24764.1 phasin family protein [Variovorax sp. SRS16]VTU32930.1 phasin family protein [Variovorax sp. PBL-E5]